MTSRERMARAMRPQAGLLPDRVPVMCQLALGHYFLQSGFDATEIWHDTTTFGDALITLQRRYGFDGILVNLPGRDSEWGNQILSAEKRGADLVIGWRGGPVTVMPPDDNPHVYPTDAERRAVPRFDDLDPERLFYIEPHDVCGVTYPYAWGFTHTPAQSGPHFFPPWHFDTIRYVRERAPDVSVHGEVFSPFSQLLELVDYPHALVALLVDPEKAKACLDRLADGTIALALGQAAAGVDAVLISSAFAGAGFISPAHYREFVLPYERKVIDAVTSACPDLPVYTHTCGAIGDRLELMEQTGTHGIDTLDPPPLGTVDLADAKARLGTRVFIKGNLDPVNTLLNGTPDDCLTASRERLATGKPGGGYILSSACSVAPHTPPENILQLRAAVEEAGWY
jgi:hypothetical protein